MKIRIGTRGSKLARWQAEWVAAELAKQDVETELIVLKTLGDVKPGPIGNVGTQGVFTKEIQRALLDNQVDLAVHSLKDLPTDDTEGLQLAAIPPREKCSDALIANPANGAQSIDDLRPGAIVATGSMRRRAQLLAYREDIQVCDLRGNVDTRLQKLTDDNLDAIILAEAGLRRLGLDAHITQVIPKEIMLPAVGQGALGLECRDDDTATAEVLAGLDHPKTHYALVAERSLLRSLRGGCLAPVGAWARLDGDDLQLDAVVLSKDGKQKVTAQGTAPLTQGEELGILIANQLIAQGADVLLKDARS